MEYITIKQAAEEWNLTERTICNYCEKGRIEGVIHAGKLWIIPMDAAKPSNTEKCTELKLLANKVAYQRSKNAFATALSHSSLTTSIAANITKELPAGNLTLRH